MLRGTVYFEAVAASGDVVMRREVLNVACETEGEFAAEVRGSRLASAPTDGIPMAVSFGPIGEPWRKV